MRRNKGMMVKGAGGVLGARVLVGKEFLDREVRSAYDSGMMSDVLTFSEGYSVLPTGLCNPQIIRTAEVLGIVCIIFARGKKPDGSMLEMARNRGFVVMEADRRILSACGILYQAGLHDGAIWCPWCLIQYVPEWLNVFRLMPRENAFNNGGN